MNLVLAGALTKTYSAVRGSGFLDTRMGKRLFASSYFFYKRHLEDPYHGLIEKHPELFRGGHILDVGANIGYCSVLFAGAIEKPFHVYAFEPEPRNYQLLTEVLARRELAGAVRAMQAAVGAGEGEIELWVNEDHHGDHRVLTDAFRESRPGSRSIKVPLIAIDGYLEPEPMANVRLVKIDVQGYELAVCRGMSKTLEASPDCVVALEYMPDAMTDLGYNPADLLQFFKDRGFQSHTISRTGELQPGLPLDVAAGQWIDLVFMREHG